MERFAVVNLLELEDRVGGRVEGLQARFARTELDSRHLGVSHFRYAPNFRAASGHRHREQEEAYIVIAGTGQILLDESVHELRRWDVVRIAPDVLRAFAAGPEGLELIVVGGPVAEGRDGEMVEITWPDTAA